VFFTQTAFLAYVDSFVVFNYFIYFIYTYVLIKYTKVDN